MAKSSQTNDVFISEGVFYIRNVPVGLTRGGGQFLVERETKQIEADGDRGYVKGRIRITKAVPKLVINMLEIIGDNLPKMYAALKVTEEEGKKVVTGTGKIVDADYQDYVKFIGTTDKGQEVVIRIDNAINLENIDWTLADKDEVVPAITYIGCYLEDSPDGYEPWSVSYAPKA